MAKKTSTDYIHDMLVRIDDRLDGMAETLIRHDENLKTHMKRSDSNEEAIELLKTEMLQLNKARDKWTFIKQLGGYLLAIAGFCYYITKIYFRS